MDDQDVDDNGDMDYDDDDMDDDDGIDEEGEAEDAKEDDSNVDGDNIFDDDVDDEGKGENAKLVNNDDEDYGDDDRDVDGDDGDPSFILTISDKNQYTEDLDTYDSNCDDISNAKAVLMANISIYGSDVILEVAHSETYLNDMENQSVHAMQDFKQSTVMDFPDNEINSNSTIIPYSQYLQETQQTNVQDTNLQAQQDSMIIFVIEQMLCVLAIYRTKVKGFAREEWWRVVGAWSNCVIVR
nr:hypothetical protein [Tanacetum cinerariifolium]